MKNLIPLFFIIFFTESAKAQSLDCSRLWRAGFPDRDHRTEPLPCEKFVSGELRSGLNLYIDEGMKNDPRILDFARAMAQSLKKSKVNYGLGGIVPDISAVIYRRSYWGNTDIITYASAFLDFASANEPCPVVIYPEALQFNIEQVKQIIAHEVYHCHQKQHSPNQSLLAARSQVGLWFFEGIAQQMSDTVYPRADLEWDPKFPRYNPQVPLTEQNGYANVVFFMSWFKSTLYSFGEMRNFTNAMPTISTGSAEEAFARIPNSAKYFHEFAQGFNSATIADASGRLVPYQPQSPSSSRPVQRLEEQSFDIVVQPLMTQYHRFVLPKKGIYRFVIDSQDGNYLKASTKNRDEEEWSSIGEEIHTACDTDSEQDLLITSINPNKQIALVQVKVFYHEEYNCGCESNTPPVDQCLFGSWRLDNESVRTYFENVFRESNNELLGVSGDISLTFSDNGNLDFKINNWLVTSLTTIAGSTKKIKVESLSVGEATAQYSDQQSSRVCAQRKTGLLKMLTTIYLDSGPITSPGDPILAPADRRIEFSYECHGNELIYKEGLGVGADGSNVTYNFKFIRR